MAFWTVNGDDEQVHEKYCRVQTVVVRYSVFDAGSVTRAVLPKYPAG